MTRYFEVTDQDCAARISESGLLRKRQGNTISC